MFYIKLEKDESLVITVKEDILRGENLSQKIIYLIPAMIDDIDVGNSRVYLNYIRADGTPNVVQLKNTDTKYNESYYQYTFPIECKITNVPGDVCTWLHFVPNGSEQVVAKSKECVLTIQDTKDINDCEDKDGILPDLQDRVAFAENNIEKLNKQIEEIDVGQGGSTAEYGIIKEESDEYYAVYQLTKDGEKVGETINIPNSEKYENAEVLQSISQDDLDAWSSSEQNAKDYASEKVDELKKVYFGTDEPTDPNVVVWVNPEGHTEDVLGDINSSLDEIIAIQESYIAQSSAPVNEEVLE